MQTHTPSVEATATRKCLARLPCPLVVFALAAPDPRLIDLNREVTANAVEIRAHHRYTQLVQDLEGRFVALQTELPLDPHSAHARRLARHEVRSPKPDRDRRVRALHDRAGRERCVTLAVATAKHHRSPVRETAWLTMPLAVLADKAFGPSDPLQVCGARCVIRKKPHEVRQGCWE